MALTSSRADVTLVHICLPDMRERVEVQRSRLVALTGFGTADDRARALAAGFDDHMVKPASMDALQRLLTETARIVGRTDGPTVA